MSARGETGVLFTAGTPRDPTPVAREAAGAAEDPLREDPMPSPVQRSSERSTHAAGLRDSSVEGWERESPLLWRGGELLLVVLVAVVVVAVVLAVQVVVFGS